MTNIKRDDVQQSFTNRRNEIANRLEASLFGARNEDITMSPRALEAVEVCAEGIDTMGKYIDYLEAALHKARTRVKDLERITASPQDVTVVKDGAQVRL